MDCLKQAKQHLTKGMNNGNMDTCILEAMNDTRNKSTPSSAEGTVATMAVPVLMFAVGVIGNTIAIVALSRSKQERKASAFYALVCGLAVTDLLGTCLASPITIAFYLNANVLDDHALCEFHSFLLLFFGVVGLSIICAMSAERYLAICRPYTYQRWGVNQNFARKCLFLIYISNICFCCLPVMGVATSVSQSSHTWCFIDWRTHEPVPAAYSFLYGSVSFLLILMTMVLNCAVCGTLIVMRRRTIQSPVTRASARARWRALSSGAETQMITVLVITSIVVSGFSAPLVVRVFVNQITLQEDSQADLSAIRAAAVNAILDPWIYILLRRTLFRKIMRFSKRLCRSRNVPVLTSPRRTLLYREDIRDSRVCVHLCEALSGATNTCSAQIPAVGAHTTQDKDTPVQLP